MFIASMYSFGRHDYRVGVDGIVTCMAVFLSYGGRLYAIHVPADNNRDLGWMTFVDYVRQQEPNFNGANARLWCVTNNNQRPNADVELTRYARELGVRHPVHVRLINNLGAQGMPNAAAILCHFLPDGRGPVLSYRQHAEGMWQAGLGTRRAGHYHNAALPANLGIPVAGLANGWHLVNATNSDLMQLTVH